MSDVPARGAYAVDPVTGLHLAVPAGWSTRLGGPETARRLVLTAGDDGPAAGARIVAVCMPSGEDVRIAGPAAATVLVAGQSGRILDYDTWGGAFGRTALFTTDAPAGGGDADDGPLLGRLWMVSRHRMLTTITLLAPSRVWAAAQEAGADAIHGLRLPRPGASAPLTPTQAPARLDTHLARYGFDVEDLAALDEAQARPLLGHRVTPGCLDHLLRMPLPAGAPKAQGRPCPDVEELTDLARRPSPDEAEAAHTSPNEADADLAAHLHALGLADADDPSLPTATGLVAGRLLQRCGAAVRVDVHDREGTASAFIRVDGPHLLAVTTDATDEDDTPGQRRARDLRLHLGSSTALAVLLAGQVRLGPAWPLPMPDVEVPAPALASRWADPRTPLPPGIDNPHPAALWAARPWSLVTIRWTTGPREGDEYPHAWRVLRAGSRGWVRVRPTGAGTAALSVVPVADVWRRLTEIASAVTGRP